MKLSKVIIRNFKRFDNVTFDIPDGGVVVAGPNNCGKTTLLQAIATWRAGLECWRNKHGETDLYHTYDYDSVPMSRQSLQSVPLLSLPALWHKANPQKEEVIDIILVINGKRLVMEIYYDTTEQLYVCPVKVEDWQEAPGARNDEKIENRGFRPSVDEYELIEKFIFIPSMSGISIEEPVYQDAKIHQLLGQNKPGEVLRNLLVKAHNGNKDGWNYLCGAIRDIFGYELLQPDSLGANIVAEYRDGNVKLDIASAGSGFLQVLLLLALFVNRKECVVLLDEPDAHLHILLQDRIYAKLKEFARISNSTLIMATHSERIINSVPPGQICALLAKPKLLASDYERQRLISGLGLIDNTDILLAESSPGILYVEGPSDIGILREWARVLNHPLLKFLESPFWKRSVYREGKGEGKAKDKGKIATFAEKHFDAMQQIDSKMVGVELYDSDGKDGLQKGQKFQGKLKRLFWRRYDIENYLMHPETVANFILRISGQPSAGKKAAQHMKHKWSPAFCENPQGEHPVNKSKGRDLLSEVFQAAGVNNFSNYSELAAAMPKEAIHPEVVEKLDAIAKAFGIMEP